MSGAKKTYKPRAIIVDVDGTVAKMVNRKPFDWDLVDTDKPVKVIIDLVKILSGIYKVIFVSGRSDECRDKTAQWLKENVLPGYEGLFMRKAGDYRKDDIVKKEIYENHIKEKYDVVFSLDDRNQTVANWRNLGITCLQVADGNF